MQPGVPMIEKFYWSRDENFDRHEPFPSLGFGSFRRRQLSRALVEHRKPKRPRRRDPLSRSEEGWVVLTQDLDFGTILAVSNRRRPSVIQIRSEDLSPEAASNGVLATIWQLSSELEQGALVTLDPRRTRVRYLPLHPGQGT
jgi:hypothetical protein